MKQIGLFFIILLLVTSCGSCHLSKKVKQISTEELRSSSEVMIEQAGNIYGMMEDFTSIELKRQAFDIYFTMPPMNRAYKQNYTCQISAMKTKAEADKTQVGKKHDDIPYFSPGTGMATLGPYESLYFAEAQHYIFYELGGHQRAELVEELEGDKLRLKWSIPQLKDDGTQYTFEDFPFDTFYLVVMIDRNLNKVVDEGEARKIEIKLK